MSDEALIDALNAKTAEYDVKIAELEKNILRLQQELEIAMERQEQAALLQSQVDEWTAKANAAIADNQALRKNLADYLTSTDGGKAALKDFEVMILAAQAEAIQKRLAELA